MQQYVSVEVLANWVSMTRPGVAGAILLPDDEEEARFYERCAHRNACVVPASGAAYPLLRILRRRGIRGVVALLRGSSVEPSVDEGVFRSELGDLASVLVASGAFDAVVRELCGLPWIGSCTQACDDLRGSTINLARAFTRVRAAADEIGIAPPEWEQFIEWVDWGSCRVVIERVPRVYGEVPFDDLTDVPKGESEVRRAVLECDGTDVLCALEAAMRLCAPHGLRAERLLSVSELFSALRMAFPLEELERDVLFWHLRTWQRVNGYALLAEWRQLDPLGVLLDQRYWEEDLCREHEGTREGERLGVAKFDLDNFKQVNETLGHSMGDEAIRHYCEIVRRSVANRGDAYRRGGDEVVVLAPRVEVEQFKEMCEEVRVAVESGFQDWYAERGMTAPLTASVGAVVAGSGTNLTELMQMVDEAQIAAKRAGKNLCVIRLLQD